ncbi:MAG: YggT family protein [Deltaproteobacteria bacterium]|nr:YggT family protein [Deltaproteobacteria bacterium]MCL4874374.1 YggT family protein [bacterium]
MFMLANIIIGLTKVLDTVLTLYFWIIVIRAIISWVNPDPYNPIVRFLYQITEPVLGRVRRILPQMGGLDISPLIVILIIYFVQAGIIPSLYELANRLKTGGGF